MNDPHFTQPLAPFHGERPPAPEWFLRALLHAPDRRSATVEGARTPPRSYAR